MSTADLTDAIVYLVRKQPFYAHLVQNMSRHITTQVGGRPLTTAGVNVTDTVNLFINPYFWNSLTVEEQAGVLVHEVHHVVNNHFGRMRDLEPTIFDDSKKDVSQVVESMVQMSDLNQAADAAINEHIPNLPKKFSMFDAEGNIIKDEKGKPIKAEPVLAEKLAKQFKGMDRYQNMEYYYGFLKQERKKQKNQAKQNQCGSCDGTGKDKNDPNSDCDSCKGTGKKRGNTPATVDDHGVWQMGNPDADYVKEKIKQVVDKAIDANGGRSAGNIPNELEQAINALYYQPKDWRSDLQRFVSRSMEVLIESSRKRRNRRYGTLYPGYRSYPKLHLAVCIDTSGSVADDELGQFFAEIDRIHKNDVKITVVEFDTKVNAVYNFDPKKEITVHGRGGTLFASALEECDKLDIDGIVFFTDGGDCGNNAKKPKVPLLWALTSNGSGYHCPYKWGSRTEIKVTRRKTA